MTDRIDIVHGTTPYRIVVIELDDLLPRLESGLPNLLVSATTTSPDDRLASVNRPNGRPGWAAGHGRCIRGDLSLTKTYDRHRSAKKAAQRLVDRLRRQGYVVNGRNDQRRVYVIELDHSHLTKSVSGYFYVGETSLSPEQRFEQHRTGARSSKGHSLGARHIGPYVRRLRPDLAPTEFFLTEAEAAAAEADTRLRLENAGYLVRGAHTVRRSQKRVSSTFSSP
ncbi:MAG: hypothetical protein ACO23O_08680 [Ilumatobacteraceae bacterium]